MSKSANTSKNNDIALKASKKSRGKEKVEESSSEEDESSNMDDEEMALFIRRFKRFMKKERYNKGDNKKDKSRTRGKRSCYNCGKSGYFIANCPYEKKDEEEGKKEKKKSFKKNEKFFKKKIKGEAYLGKEWDSNDENSDSDDEHVATLAFNKISLFPNLK